MIFWSFVFNIWVALLMGTLIGIERQWRQQHTAGLRTNALVSLGAALFVGLSTIIEHDSSPSRISAQVVSGLGFLGGGVIMRDGANVRGLNTAATLWCSGAVGALARAGFALQALMGTLAVLFVHLGLPPVVRWIDHKRKADREIETYYRLRIESDAESGAPMRQLLHDQLHSHDNLSLHGLSTDDLDNSRIAIIANIFSMKRVDREVEAIVALVSLDPQVRAVSWERTNT